MVPFPFEKLKGCACLLSHCSLVQLFATLWAVAQAPLSMGFCRQKYWSGLPCLTQGDLPDPGIKPGSPALQADSLPLAPPGANGPPQIHLFIYINNCKRQQFIAVYYKTWKRLFVTYYMKKFHNVLIPLIYLRDCPRIWHLLGHCIWFDICHFMFSVF